MGDHIVGPVFFDGTLNGQKYLSFLENDLGPLLEDVPLDLRRHMWFQHDGAPAHYARPVQEWLHRHFPKRWIGRGDARVPVGWPPRSPELTAMDFFLWGYVKNQVYATPSQSPADLKARIIAACAAITPQTLNRVHNATLRRIKTCVEQDGQLFEHLL